MNAIKLKHQLDENKVVNALVEVNKIKKLSKSQMADIFSLSPNHLPPIVERANLFLEKMAYMITMFKLQEKCDDEEYADTHSDDVKAVNAYISNDPVKSDKCGDDMVELLNIHFAIGKFCMSTEKFFKEVGGTPGKDRSELLKNILLNLNEELKEREEDSTSANRYAYRFFRKLLDKNSNCLPKGVTKSDMQLYMKRYIYDDELNR